MHIRQETANDYSSVHSVIEQAFASAEHSDGNEADLVSALRKGKSFIPKLSLVAEIDGKIVGHILFTKARIENNVVLALAPLSVLPKFQKQGIGTALIKEGHRIAKELGYKLSVVLGSESYYPRVGYSPADNFGIQAPFEVPRENFMAFKLVENTADIQGTLRYAEEFGIY